jgi:hypothetical protein
VHEAALGGASRAREDGTSKRGRPLALVFLSPLLFFFWGGLAKMVFYFLRQHLISPTPRVACITQCHIRSNYSQSDLVEYLFQPMKRDFLRNTRSCSWISPDITNMNAVVLSRQYKTVVIINAILFLRTSLNKDIMSRHVLSGQSARPGAGGKRLSEEILSDPMALHRALSPSLVLCGPCRELDGQSDRLVALAEPESGALLVRDVCAAADCPELQLRGHLCADHALELELAWLQQIPVRACHSCRQSVLVLYREKHDVWFILPRNGRSDAITTMRGLELKYLDKSRLEKSSALDEAAFQSPARATKGKARSKLSSGKKRRSARTLQQICDRERLRALEWSLGNVQVKPLFLWKDNKHRLEAEKMPPPGTEQNADKNGEPRAQDDAYALPEPLTVCCSVPKCRFFAKSGDRCLFHSGGPLPFRPLPPGVVFPPRSVAPRPTPASSQPPLKVQFPSSYRKLR